MKKTIFAVLLLCLLLLCSCGKIIDADRAALLEANRNRLEAENIPSDSNRLPDDAPPEIAKAQRKTLEINVPKKAYLLSRYDNAAVMGDSLIHAALEYGYLDNSKIIARIGASVLTAKDLAEQAVRVRPDTLFLCFGLNDVEIYEENGARFIRDYEKLISDLQTRLPDTRIRILAISPVNDKAMARIPAYQYIEEYNEALEEMCDRLDLRFIDAAFLLEDKPDYYDNDGVHPKGNYYPRWLYYLAEVGGLPDAEN